MPSTYAHYKFACEVKNLLPARAARAVENNLPLYLTGCHGPDILFYYKAIKKNDVNAFGYDMHGRSAAPFFESARAIALGDDPSLSYIMGFITHFALDSTCHGYVESERKELGITHTKLEVEFDRFLLAEDGCDPVKRRLAGHITTDRRDAATIASFFPFNARQIERSLKDMKRICNLFRCPGRIKRGIVGGILRSVSRELPDQIMGRKPDPVCLESNKKMRELFASAVPVAGELFENFLVTPEGKGLCERFDRNYE